MLRVIRAFLPALRKQGSGTIMNLSSIAGISSFPTNGIYCASKFAVEAITQALAGEVEPFGLQCVAVEPGYFRTEFLANANPSQSANLAPAIDAYDGTPAHDARKALDDYNGQQPGNPEKGVARMWEYVAGEGMFAGGRKKLGRLPLGSDCGKSLKDVSKALAEAAESYEDVWKSTDFED